MSWRLKTSKTALLIVDAQEKVFSHIPERENLEKRLKQLVQGAAMLEIPVYFAQHSLGGEILPAIRELAPEARAFSRENFSAGEFAGEISGENVLLAGVEGHIAVRQTAYDLRMKEKNPYLVADGIASRNPANQEVAFSEMQADRFLLTTVETCLFELLEGTNHPKYKAISKLLK